MNHASDWFITILTVVIIILLVMAIPMRIGYNIGYRNGQIEAALGTQNYYLKAMPDSTKKWMKRGD